MAGGATALCVTGWGEAAVKACAGLPRHDPWLNKCPRVELLRLRAAEAQTQLCSLQSRLVAVHRSQGTM